MKVPFNIPFTSDNEVAYINEVINTPPNTINEVYTGKCKALLKAKWNFNEVFLTTSCTTALEVCALLIDIKQGDEVIMSSYTFPSTANAFLRQGARIVFADTRNNYPVLDERLIESLITENTKAIVPVHYAGIACNMERIMDIAEKNGLYVIEDAALAFDAHYKSKPLGTIGNLGCLSFHSSKNLQCGEGGAIVINDNRFNKRVLSILEKGTNRNEFVSGIVERYEWVDVGSSFLMTELHAAYLYAQLEKAEWIKGWRLSLWNTYYNSLKNLEERGVLKLPSIPDYAGHNAHTFFLVLNNEQTMLGLKAFLSEKDIQATTHYTPLDQSQFWKKNYPVDRININTLGYNHRLLRLPLYNSMNEDTIHFVIAAVLKYFNV